MYLNLDDDLLLYNHVSKKVYLSGIHPGGAKLRIFSAFPSPGTRGVGLEGAVVRVGGGPPGVLDVLREDREVGVVAVTP